MCLGCPCRLHLHFWELYMWLHRHRESLWYRRASPVSRFSIGVFLQSGVLHNPFGLQRLWSWSLCGGCSSWKQQTVWLVSERLCFAGSKLIIFNKPECIGHFSIALWDCHFKHRRLHASFYSPFTLYALVLFSIFRFGHTFPIVSALNFNVVGEGFDN